MLEVARDKETVARSEPYVAKIIYTDNETGESLVSDTFNLSTYRDQTKDWSKEEHVYQVINQFIETLPDKEDQRPLFDYYVSMYEMMSHLTYADFSTIHALMRTKTTEFMQGHDIPKKLLHFVHHINLKFPDLSLVGTREHRDSEDRSFKEEEYYILIAISILCKLMTPVWGEFSNRMRNFTRNSLNHTLFCSNLIFDVLEEAPEFQRTFFKLKNYSDHTCYDTIVKEGATSSPPPDFILAQSGIDLKRFQETVFSQILMKKLVIYHTWENRKQPQSEPDIMSHIYSGIKIATTTFISQLAKNTSFMTRFEVIKTSENDNISFLDNMARVGKVSADIPNIARFSIARAIEKRKAELKIDETLFKNICKYYEIGLVRQNPINEAMVASFFVRDIGGSTLIKYLKREMYTQAVTITQLYMVSNGFHEIVPYMTCHSSDMEKIGTVAVSNSILTNYTKTHEYRECVEHLFVGFSSKRKDRSNVERISFASQIDMLVKWVLLYEHRFNVAPEITAAMNLDPVPAYSEEIYPSDKIAVELMRFFIHCHKYTDEST